MCIRDRFYSDNGDLGLLTLQAGTGEVLSQEVYYAPDALTASDAVAALESAKGAVQIQDVYKRQALGVGVATVRGGKNVGEDSFGLVALCSIGPILAVLVLGMFFDPTSGAYAAAIMPHAQDGWQLMSMFGHGLIEYAGEVGLALSPIVAFFIVFQLLFLKLPVRRLLKLLVGLVYTCLLYTSRCV